MNTQKIKKVIGGGLREIIYCPTDELIKKQITAGMATDELLHELADTQKANDDMKEPDDEAVISNCILRNHQPSIMPCNLLPHRMPAAFEERFLRQLDADTARQSSGEIV